MAAPVGGILWGFGALAVRLAYQFIVAKVGHKRFDALDRPLYLDRQVQGEATTGEYANSDEVREDVQDGLVTVDHKGKFF